MPAKKEGTIKKSTVKGLPTTVKTAASKTSGSPKSEVSKRSSLSVPVYSLIGKVAGNLDLPKDIFGVTVNQVLLAQALKVYQNNQKSHHSNTKTRGEIVGSTRKIYKQKGTGRARHGAISAPIFVGGGIALGPKFRKVVLELPKKMKTKALISALAQKASENTVIGLTGLEKHSGKTKDMAKFLKALKLKSTLIIVDQKLENAQRASRNLKGLNFVTADQVNVLEIIRHQSLVLTKEAVEKLQERVSVKESRGPAASVSRVRPRSANKPAAVDSRDPSSASPLDSKQKKGKI